MDVVHVHQVVQHVIIHLLVYPAFLDIIYQIMNVNNALLILMDVYHV